MTRQIFISHAKQDKEIVYRIVAGLEAAGYTTWYYERDNVLGQSHLVQVRHAIERAKTVLVVVSEHSLASNDVSREIDRGHESDRPFLPLLLGVTYDEMDARRPDWGQAFGTSIAHVVSRDDPAAGLPRIIEGLRALGILPGRTGGAAAADDASASQPCVFTVESRIPPRPLYGRDAVVREALRVLRGKSLAITGIKGIGKSKVLSAVFQRLQEDRTRLFRTFYWRRVGPGHTFSDFAWRIVADLTGNDIDIRGVDLGEQVQLLVRALRRVKCLLAIDQFESAIDPTTRVPHDAGFAELLSCANQGLDPARVVVTAWETPKDSSGFSLPSLPLAGLDQPSALRLIAARCRTHFSAEVKDRLAEITSRLSGHPYAIELLARNYSADDIQRLLSADAELRQGEVASIAAQVASAVVSRLPADLRPVVDAVSILGETITVDAVARMLGRPRHEVFRSTSELVARNLVFTHGDRGYEVHSLIRDHVLQQLSEDERRHLHLSAAGHYRMLPVPAPAYRSRIDDVAPLLAAIDHLLSAAAFERAADMLLADVLPDQLFRWGHLEYLKRLYERFDHKAISVRTSSIIRGRHGMVCRDLGELDQARACFDEALALARACGDSAVECEQLVNLGDLDYYAAEYARSLEYHQGAQELIASGVGDRNLEGRNIGCFGNALLGMGRLDEADTHYEQATAICRETGDRRCLGIWLGNLGAVRVERGNITGAVECFEQALILARETGDRRHEAWWLGVGARARASLGETDRAIRDLLDALSLSEAILYRRGLVQQLNMLYLMARQAGRFETAIQPLERATQLARETRNQDLEQRWRGMLADVLLGSATSHARLGELERAISDYDRVLELDPERLGTVLSRIEVEIWMGRYAHARETLRRFENRLSGARERFIAAWLMGLADTLDGRPGDRYLAMVSESDVSLSPAEYDPRDVEPYLARLAETGVPPERLTAAMEIHRAFKAHFVGGD